MKNQNLFAILWGSLCSMAIGGAAVAAPAAESMAPALGSLLSIVLGAWVGRARPTLGRAVGDAAWVTALAVGLGTAVRGLYGVLPWPGVAIATSMGAATAAIAGLVAFKIASRGRNRSEANAS